MIAAAFEGREIKMIVMTALMGGLAPFCSCEVIPFIAALLPLGVFGCGVLTVFYTHMPLPPNTGSDD